MYSRHQWRIWSWRRHMIMNNNTSMADEVILLSDDEAPPTTVPSKVPKGSGIDRSTSSRASPIILGLSPLRSSSMRRDSTEVAISAMRPILWQFHKIGGSARNLLKIAGFAAEIGGYKLQTRGIVRYPTSCSSLIHLLLELYRLRFYLFLRTKFM